MRGPDAPRCSILDQSVGWLTEGNAFVEAGGDEGEEIEVKVLAPMSVTWMVHTNTSHTGKIQAFYVAWTLLGPAPSSTWFAGN